MSRRDAAPIDPGGTLFAVTEILGGATVELGAEAEAGGKAQFALTAQLLDDTGELVAETHGTYQLRLHGT